MSLNLFLTFDIESNRPGDYITCAHVPGAPGLYWIMDQLERHGLRGVFFVNVYEHTRYADGWMAGILRDIHERGHEVGLHCHPNRDLAFYRRPLPRYDVAGQTRILRYGVDLIEAATGQPPRAFRAGALRLNDATFRALEQCHVTIDSSLLYFTGDDNPNEIDRYLSVNRHAAYGAVHEFPITVIDRDGRRGRLDPNVVPDSAALIAAVEQMVEAGCADAVWIGHSFSFVLTSHDPAAALPGTAVFRNDEQKYAAGRDAHLQSVFVDFLRLVAAARPRVQTALFREVAQSGEATGGVDFVPRVPFNRLRPWPSVRDYTKQQRLIRWWRRPTYHTRPRHLVLHAGTWKTGSKALQKFWAINQEELRRRGLFYPLTATASYMDGANQSYQSRLATSGDGDRSGRLRALAAEINASQCQTCLVSHENICNLSARELLEFVAHLPGWRFTVVLYLRRQDHYAESLYNQHVKAGVSFPGTFGQHFARYRDRYDYRRMVTKLGTVFGFENIVVRPYEREQFHGDTIYADFMHHGLAEEIDRSLVIPERDRNSRLARDTLELKRIINALRASKAHKLRFGRSLVAYAESVDPRIRMAFQEHNLLSPEQRTRLVAAYADGNAWIARRFLAREDGVLFREPLPDEQQAWAAYPGLTGEKAAEILFHLCRSLRQELDLKGAEIARLRAEGSWQIRPFFGRQRGRWANLRPALERLWKCHLRPGKAWASRGDPKPKSEVPG